MPAFAPVTVGTPHGLSEPSLPHNRKDIPSVNIRHWIPDTEVGEHKTDQAHASMSEWVSGQDPALPSKSRLALGLEAPGSKGAEATVQAIRT